MTLKKRLISFIMVALMLVSPAGDLALAGEEPPAPYSGTEAAVDVEMPAEAEMEEAAEAASPGEAEPAPGQEDTAAEAEPVTAEPEDVPEEPGSESEPEQESEPEPEPESEVTPAPESGEELVRRELSVQPERAALYDEWGDPTETLAYAGRFWRALFDRDPAPVVPEEPDRDPVPAALTFRGMLPEGVTAEARFVGFDELEAYSENALFYIELTLRDERGEVYVPEGEITVVLEGEAVSEALRDEQPLLVYAWEEDARRSEEYGVYAADVLVYRDVFGRDERLAYEVYDETRYYEDHGDAVRFTEDRDGLTVYVDDTVDFTWKYDEKAEDAGGGPLRFVLSAQLGERALEADAGDTSVVISGPISENVSAEAEAVDYEPASADGGGRRAGGRRAPVRRRRI